LFIHDSHYQAIGLAQREISDCDLIGSGNLKLSPDGILTLELAELSIFLCSPQDLKSLLEQAFPHKVV
jgi:hypothetical protein